jgi:hypothetical protein
MVRHNPRQKGQQMSTKHTPGPWLHHYSQGKSFVLSTSHMAGPFLGDVVATEGTDRNALANHKRIVQCVNIADALTAALAADQYLSDPLNADREVVRLIRSLGVAP